MSLNRGLFGKFAVLSVILLSVAAGAENRQQIGWVIVGGMSVGTLLTLFVVPAVYTSGQFNSSIDEGSNCCLWVCGESFSRGPWVELAVSDDGTFGDLGAHHIDGEK